MATEMTRGDQIAALVVCSLMAAVVLIIITGAEYNNRLNTLNYRAMAIQRGCSVDAHGGVMCPCREGK